MGWVLQQVIRITSRLLTRGTFRLSLSPLWVGERKRDGCPGRAEKREALVMLTPTGHAVPFAAVAVVSADLTQGKALRFCSPCFCAGVPP